MARAVADILADIAAFAPPADIMRGWRPFAELVAELKDAGGLPAAIPALLGYFERHPTVRTISWLWEVAHTLERMPGEYETAVLQSLRRCPSDFAVRLAGRFVAARGRVEVGGVWVEEVLEEAARREDVAGSLRELIGWIVRTCCEPPAESGAEADRPGSH
jgi:hypothetical protein